MILQSYFGEKAEKHIIDERNDGRTHRRQSIGPISEVDGSKNPEKPLKGKGWTRNKTGESSEQISIVT